MTTNDRMTQAYELEQQTKNAYETNPCGSTLTAYLGAVNEFSAAVENYIRDLEDSARFFKELAARQACSASCPHLHTTIDTDGYRSYADGDIMDTEHVWVICLDCGDEVDPEPPDAGEIFDAKNDLP